MENNDIRILMRHGFSERQAKVYLALLNQGSATAAELQNSSGIIKTKVYEIVKSLAQKGYCCERKVGRKRTFKAIDPQLALSSFIPQLESDLNDTRNMIKRLSKRFAESSEIIEPFEYIEIVRGNENSHKKYLELLLNTKTEMLGFARPPFASSQISMRIEQRNAYKNIVKSGATTRAVYEVNDNSSSRMFYLVHDGLKHEEHFRITPKLPLKMVIFDRKTLLITEKESLINGDNLVNTVIKQKATVNGYIALFDFFWEQSLEYEKWIIGKEKLMEKKLAEFEKNSK